MSIHLHYSNEFNILLYFTWHQSPFLCCVFVLLYLWTRSSLPVATCIPANCSGNGVCIKSVCYCFSGYTGMDCGLSVLGQCPATCDVCSTKNCSSDNNVASDNGQVNHHTIKQYCQQFSPGECVAVSLMHAIYFILVFQSIILVYIYFLINSLYTWHASLTIMSPNSHHIYVLCCLDVWMF